MERDSHVYDDETATHYEEDQHQRNAVRKRQRADLEERTYWFAHRVRELVKDVPHTPGNEEDIKQAVRSSGFLAASYVEANEAINKKDFCYKIKLCRKQAKESRLWLRLLECDEEQDEEQGALQQEAHELMLIFSSIASKTDRPRHRQQGGRHGHRDDRNGGYQNDDQGFEEDDGYDDE